MTCWPTRIVSERPPAGLCSFSSQRLPSGTQSDFHFPRKLPGPFQGTHLEQLHREGIAILQVEQNAREVLRRAQYAYVMAAGEIVLEGPAEAIRRDPRVLESYVG